MLQVSVPRQKLAWSLFGLRLGIFIVMVMWTVDKFVNPEHAAAVFKTFYMIEGLSNMGAYVVGALQAAVILAFLVGFQKRWSTGLVLAMHLVSTLTPMARYFDPWAGSNLLFFAAWPMLFAIVALYILRDYDTQFSVAATVPASKGSSS
ncbi:hypothetical protein FKG94_02585 [Exilibacterium tricleocarpae]|uniref:DoxX family membrane protein n=1 Tax=Exilibacterium tricleocarpae TaxID=2591008 RepID=A0A545U8G2_9GAMM|nr:hypothetical protein [Exilibacterium tricleocarpae]TQV85748.1 hypothetical protein FKG94_02585 [Exilibacterium tricleocarpae]